MTNCWSDVSAYAATKPVAICTKMLQLYQLISDLDRYEAKCRAAPRLQAGSPMQAYCYLMLFWHPVQTGSRAHIFCQFSPHFMQL